ncbi:MAG: hypothetical protein MJ053_06330 [Elusimicrobiaceae bacterium]|nr:hypothetical protein [Elusimicrobiaceae bacterium]
MGEKQSAAKLGVIGLACIVISSMVGGGVFSLPQNMAAGVKYLFMAVIFLALGIPVFMRARREQAPNEPRFSGGEKVVVTLLVLCAVAAVCMMCRGHVHL